MNGGIEVEIPRSGWGKAIRSPRLGTRKGCKVLDDAFVRSTGGRNYIQIWVLENKDQTALDAFAQPKSTFMKALVARARRRTANSLDAYFQVDVCDPPYNDLLYDCAAMIEVNRETFVELEASFYVGTSQAEMTAQFESVFDSLNATADPPTAR